MRRYQIVTLDDIQQSPTFPDLNTPPVLGTNSSMKYEENKGHLIRVDLPSDSHLIEPVIVDVEEMVTNKDLTFLDREDERTETEDGTRVVTKGRRKKKEPQEKKKKPVTPEMYEQRRKFLLTLDQNRLVGDRLGRENTGYGVLELIEMARRLGIDRAGKKKTDLVIAIKQLLQEYGLLRVPMDSTANIDTIDENYEQGIEEVDNTKKTPEEQLLQESTSRS